MSPENQENSSKQDENEQDNQTRKPRSQKRRASKRQGGRKRQRPTKPPERTPVEELLMRFAGCSRCVYFLLSYQSTTGREVLETAVAESDDEWLQLNWVDTLPMLVEKSYGITLDRGDFYVEGSCPVCQRVFVFTTETDEELADFQISL